MAKQKAIRMPEGLQAWMGARRRFRLSHAQVQMAGELGLNPKKLGKIANHDQEPWKAPLPRFIETLYQKRFGKTGPDRVRSLEERAMEIHMRKEAKRERKRLKRAAGDPTGEEA